MADDYMVKRELPDKIIQMDQIRINRNLDKLCTCDKRKYTIDSNNKRVLCSSCGSVVDAYDAMLDMARNFERINADQERMLEQRKQIANYKPWLLTIRNLEKQYRGKKTLPCCPRCDEPFYLEELKSWFGKDFADARIRKWREENE